jgi:hypothetical protein
MSNSVAWEMCKCSVKCGLAAFIGALISGIQFFNFVIIRRKKSRQVTTILEELLGSYVPMVLHMARTAYWLLQVCAVCTAAAGATQTTVWFLKLLQLPRTEIEIIFLNFFWVTPACATTYVHQQVPSPSKNREGDGTQAGVTQKKFKNIISISAKIMRHVPYKISMLKSKTLKF